MQIALTLQGCAVIVLFGGSLLPTFWGDKKLLINILQLINEAEYLMKNYGDRPRWITPSEIHSK